MEELKSIRKLKKELKKGLKKESLGDLRGYIAFEASFHLEIEHYTTALYGLVSQSNRCRHT